MTVVALESPETAECSMDVYVNVSQHAQARSAKEEPVVEVQDDFRTLLLLTPRDCVSLARALLEHAVVAAGAQASADPYVREIEDLLGGVSGGYLAAASRPAK